MGKIEQILSALKQYNQNHTPAADAAALSDFTGLDRSTISRYLNQLVKKGLVAKEPGRPVRFVVVEGQLGPNANNATHGGKQEPGGLNQEGAMADELGQGDPFEGLVGARDSLQVPTQQAKAAIMYPPKGLHTLLLGETGVGKSMFAQVMHDFAVFSGQIGGQSPFIHFNCADYADNPQLVMGQIFGVKKGAYTGADKERDGLIRQADGGVLFLDEVHRLPPQGQEMLFTFIDTGQFRKLGEAGATESASVRIIAATTEEPGSFLLRTFTRRIPMVITLPALKDRSIHERFTLIEHFVSQESKRIGKSIWMNKNSMISFLLYDCPNNIGQLRSDIQLACAKAFLNYKSSGEHYILINQNDIPQHVKRGLMRLKDNRDELDYLLRSHDDLLKFNQSPLQTAVTVAQPEPVWVEGEETLYYDVIEQKIEDLRQDGMGQERIQEILNVDIDTYFQEFMSTIPGRFHTDELKKVIDPEILTLTETMLRSAGAKLHRAYDEKVVFALALHLNGSIARIQQGQTIYHPNLNKVRGKYADAFVVAMEESKRIELLYNIQVPLDEIGYLTLFFAADSLDFDTSEEPKVGVLVIMHGPSTASSMVHVANTLIGSDQVEALDMPLSMSAEAMYDMAKETILAMDEGRGVLLMVDMGSLMNFGAMLSEETGVRVRTVDMTSTPLVIEAGRKAMLGRDLHDIWEGCRGRQGRQSPKTVSQEEKQLRRLIVTACFTGEGAAARLQDVLDKQLNHRESFDVKTLNILNKSAFMKELDALKQNYRILAVVGTMDVPTDDIPFISAMDLLGGKGLKALQEKVDEEVAFMQVGKSLQAHLNQVDGQQVADRILRFLDAVTGRMEVRLTADVKTGILLHLGFMVDKLKSGGKETAFDNLADFKLNNGAAFDLVRDEIRGIEKAFGISIGDHEVAYVCHMVVENGVS